MIIVKSGQTHIVKKDETEIGDIVEKDGTLILADSGYQGPLQQMSCFSGQ